MSFYIILLVKKEGKVLIKDKKQNNVSNLWGHVTTYRCKTEELEFLL